ncbi:MAG: 3-deoxy-D-manno-octulosonate 8-phosphate phosphatase [Flavobacteriaceae bacterium]|nr:3-deoxy-D-manno-octulosonate 8-phosphate phosphatase [Flavobacteriaceae bacterium]|tara:strand:- start:5542 stop:6072 length:531 start_codon:yes stop_codon:yes gene_type:complete
MDKKNYKTLLKNINTLIFDVDGVLTDSSVFVTTEGEMLRTMNTRDGFALKSAVDSGLNVCIISGGTNEGVRRRLKSLGLKNIILGAHNKLKNLKLLIKELDVNSDKIMYMGDDIPDIPAMLEVGLPCCPQDAAPEVKAISLYISHLNGGQGVARDIIEQILKIQGHWLKGYEANYD